MREWFTSLYRRLVMMRPANPPGRPYRMDWVDWQVGAFKVASIGVVVWMAVDVVPQWIALPALGFLWFVGVTKFVVLGVPLLILPLYFLWDAVWPGKAGRRPERQDHEPDRPLTQQQSIRRDTVARGLKRRYVGLLRTSPVMMRIARPHGLAHNKPK